MLKVVERTPAGEERSALLLLDEIARTGARQMLVAALGGRSRRLPREGPRPPMFRGALDLLSASRVVDIRLTIENRAHVGVTVAAAGKPWKRAHVFSAESQLNQRNV